MTKKTDCYVTKKDLTSELTKLEKRIGVHMDRKFKNVDAKFELFREYVNERFEDQEVSISNKLQENLEQTKQIVTNSQDLIMKELKDMREERAAHIASHIRIDQEIEELQQKVGII